MLGRTRRVLLWIIAGVCILAGQPPASVKGAGIKHPTREPIIAAPLLRPNEVADIITTKEGFLAATGSGVSRWGYADGVPVFEEELLLADGSSLGPCHELLVDKDGGTWIRGSRGVGYLAVDRKTPQWFTDDDGLPKHDILDIALSAAVDRVWVAGAGGLATCKIDSLQWSSFKNLNLRDIFVHPSKNIVWCMQVSRSGCFCGRYMETLQFDLSTEKWTTVPRSSCCDHALRRVEFYDEDNDWLWLSTRPVWKYFAQGPPIALDLKTGEVHTWKRDEHWTLKINENETIQEDSFGRIFPVGDSSGDVWLSSERGFWKYDLAEESWRSHPYLVKPTSGWTEGLRSKDGRLLYWACDGKVAEYHIETGLWRPLWAVAKPQFKEGCGRLLMSPDGETLWQIGPWGVAVADPKTQQGRVINEKSVLGSCEAKFVRFDEQRELALIATPRGIVVTDYRGKPLAQLTSPRPNVLHPVVEFRFTADGNEVWCLTREPSGWKKTPHVYFPTSQLWDATPELDKTEHFEDVAFSKDGGTVWVSSRGGGRREPILQRKSGTADWEPFAAKMPEHGLPVEKLYLSPDGSELWIATHGDGLFRATLNSGKVTNYRKFQGWIEEYVEQKPLVGDFVADLVFVRNGTLAVCAAGGSGGKGLSLINLKTGKVKQVRLGEVSPIEQLTAEPDDRTVTVVFNSASPRQFDTKTRKWLGEGPVGKDYGFGFMAQPTRIGDSVLLPCRRGVELMGEDGEAIHTFSPKRGKGDVKVINILPLRGKTQALCAMNRDGETGVYRLNVKQRTIKEIKRFDREATALGLAPDGRIWVGLRGRIVCFDATTGEELALHRPGDPQRLVVSAVDDVPDSAFYGIIAAPKNANQFRVREPDESAKMNKAVSVENRGMVFPSSSDPLIAVSAGGKRYVLWAANVDKMKPVEDGLPLIPREMIRRRPAEDSDEATTGLRVEDDGKWSPPQLLSAKDAPFTCLAAWCRGEDLHLLIDDSAANQLSHVCFVAETKSWKKVAQLEHGASAIERSGDVVHLIFSDGKRFGHRSFRDGRWSDIRSFEFLAKPRRVSLALTDDDVAHAVWYEGDATFAHAIVPRDGEPKVFREKFEQRAMSDAVIDHGDFVAVARPSGFVSLVYTAKLYKGHPDYGYPHERVWQIDRWSEPRVIPFPGRGFHDPKAVRYGDKAIVSWYYRASDTSVRGTRGYSMRHTDGTWTSPVALCLTAKALPLNAPDPCLYVDGKGRVHAAWNENLRETFIAEALDIGDE